MSRWELSFSLLKPNFLKREKERKIPFNLWLGDDLSVVETCLHMSKSVCVCVCECMVEKRGGRRPREAKEEEILHSSSYAWLRVESLEGVSYVFMGKCE